MRESDINNLLQKIQSDPDLEKEIRQNPVNGLLQLAEQSRKIPDSWPYRVVISVLGVVVIGSIASAIALAAFGIEYPPEIFTIASAAAGGLVGILTPIGGQ